MVAIRFTKYGGYVGSVGKREKRQSCGLFAAGESDSSLLARKRARDPLQGFRATIERTEEHILHLFSVIQVL